MITKEQALQLKHGEPIHENGCRIIIGPRGGKQIIISRWRVNGKVKTWKTRPEEFRVPLKHGMNGYGYLAHWNSTHFHLPADCNLEEIMGIWRDRDGLFSS